MTLTFSVCCTHCLCSSDISLRDRSCGHTKTHLDAECLFVKLQECSAYTDGIEPDIPRPPLTVDPRCVDDEEQNAVVQQPWIDKYAHMRGSAGKESSYGARFADYCLSDPDNYASHVKDAPTIMYTNAMLDLAKILPGALWHSRIHGV